MIIKYAYSLPNWQIYRLTYKTLQKNMFMIFSYFFKYGRWHSKYNFRKLLLGYTNIASNCSGGDVNKRNDPVDVV